jgi:hypothetical protein
MGGPRGSNGVPEGGTPPLMGGPDRGPGGSNGVPGGGYPPLRGGLDP